ncbi:MAG: protein-glutamate O-methyltransferase CheR [Sulfuricurvum sp.]
MLKWFRTQKTKSEPPVAEVIEDFSNPDEVFSYFTAKTGITFEQKKSITATKLAHFARDRGYASYASLLNALRREEPVMEALVNFLTVNETYFFREMAQIEYIARHAASSRFGARILCAPGSTGEEPYTIAIALSEAGADMSRIEIVSIDINTEAIERARSGLYSKRSLHRLSDTLIDRYFDPEGEKYRIRDSIRSHVRFEAMNVFDPQMKRLGTFDYLLSRNMLIYFDPPTVHAAIRALCALAKGPKSLFFFGHADIHATPSELNEHYTDGVKYYTVRS